MSEERSKAIERLKVECKNLKTFDSSYSEAWYSECVITASMVLGISQDFVSDVKTALRNLQNGTDKLISDEISWVVAPFNHIWERLSENVFRIGDSLEQVRNIERDFAELIKLYDSSEAEIEAGVAPFKKRRKEEEEKRKRIEQRRIEEERIRQAKITQEEGKVRRLSVFSLVAGLVSFFGPIISAFIFIEVSTELRNVGLGVGLGIAGSIVCIIFGVIGLKSRGEVNRIKGYSYGNANGMVAAGKVFAILGFILAGLVMFAACVVGVSGGF